MSRSQHEDRQQRQYASNSIAVGHKKCNMAVGQTTSKNAILNAFSDLKEDTKKPLMKSTKKQANKHSRIK